jgi:two-component system sensor histidine kinase KdpD
MNREAHGSLREAIPAVAGLLAIASVTVLYSEILQLSNAATVSTTFLLIVLTVAAVSTLRVAVATSVIAVLAFNFFFLPPVHTLTIAEPQNWVALFAFLAVSLIASQLSATARLRTREALARRDEMARLFDLSRDVMFMTDSQEALSQLARSIGRRFDLEYVAVLLPGADDWIVAEGSGQSRALDRRELDSAMAAAETRMEFDAYERTYAGHRDIVTDLGSVRLVPLRVAAKPVGLLAAAGRAIEPGTLDALAGVVAIGVERVRFLEERRAAALTRQSEELKTTILASVGHDLRTPLTAIKVAATNLEGSGLSQTERLEQVQLILSEAERLSRLFESLLEMARIDAHAVTAAARRVHPSEVVATARDHVERTIAAHQIHVDIDADEPVAIDPQLIAAALSHLLENAAQYSPPGSAIDLRWRTTPEAFTITVRDRGPGIAAADLPRLFDRFFRGVHGKARRSGTGMGLWIVRGLLAAHGANVWAENCPDGGAQFTISVPMHAGVEVS